MVETRKYSEGTVRYTMDELRRLRRDRDEWEFIANKQQDRAEAAAAEIERLRAAAVGTGIGAENERLQSQLRRIVDHYDCASELYTSDADLAAGMAAIARQALEGR